MRDRSHLAPHASTACSVSSWRQVLDDGVVCRRAQASSCCACVELPLEVPVARLLGPLDRSLLKLEQTQGATGTQADMLRRFKFATFASWHTPTKSTHESKLQWTAWSIPNRRTRWEVVAHPVRWFILGMRSSSQCVFCALSYVDTMCRDHGGWIRALCEIWHFGLCKFISGHLGF